MKPCDICELAWQAKALSLEAHLAHFNVTGESFGSLHGLYKVIYEAADGWFDDLGERVRALGELVEAMEIPMLDPTPKPDYVAYMLACIDDKLQTFNECLRDSSDDLVTQNMLIGIVEDLDKFKWMVKASADTDD